MPLRASTRRVIVPFVVAALALSLFACGGNTPRSDGGSGGGTATGGGSGGGTATGGGGGSATGGGGGTMDGGTSDGGCSEANLPACNYPVGAGTFTERQSTVTDAVTGRVLPLLARVPPGNGPFPVVVYSHGGGFNDQGHLQGSEWAEPLAHHGFLTVNVGHVSLDLDAGVSLCAVAQVPMGECVVPAEEDANGMIALVKSRDVVAVLDALKPGGASKPKQSPTGKPPAPPRSLEPRGTHHALTQAPLAGDAHAVPGFGFTPQWDRLFALGYPHLVLLVPDEIPEAKLDAACVDVFNKNPYELEWPEVLARPLVRLLARWAEAFKPGTHELSDVARATLRDPRDVTEAEARELLKASFSATWTHFRYVRAELFLLEALLGERATAAFVDVLTALPKRRFTKHDVVLAGTCWLLGLMLLRGTPAVRDALVAKLEAHFRKLAPDGLAPLATDESQAVYALDAVLHGAEGARRANPRGLGIGQLPFLTVPRAAALEAIRATAKVGPLATPPDAPRLPRRAGGARRRVDLGRRLHEGDEPRARADAGDVRAGE